MKKYLIHYYYYDYSFSAYIKALNKFRAIREVIRLAEKEFYYKGFMYISDIKYNISIKEIKDNNIIIGG